MKEQRVLVLPVLSVAADWTASAVAMASRLRPAYRRRRPLGRPKAAVSVGISGDLSVGNWQETGVTSSPPNGGGGALCLRSPRFTTPKSS